MVGSCPICKNAYNNNHLGKKQIIIEPQVELFQFSELIIWMNIYKCGSCGIHYGVEIKE